MEKSAKNFRDYQESIVSMNTLTFEYLFEY